MLEGGFSVEGVAAAEGPRAAPESLSIDVEAVILACNEDELFQEDGGFYNHPGEDEE